MSPQTLNFLLKVPQRLSDTQEVILVLFLKEEAGEQNKRLAVPRRRQGNLAAPRDNFRFLLRDSNPEEAAGFLFSLQLTTGYSLRTDE